LKGICLASFASGPASLILQAGHVGEAALERATRSKNRGNSGDFEIGHRGCELVRHLIMQMLRVDPGRHVFSHALKLPILRLQMTPGEGITHSDDHVLSQVSSSVCEQ